MRPKVTRAFRNQMLRDAAVMLGALFVVMMVLLRVLSSTQFALAGLVLIPATALTFNILQRRAFSAQQQGKRV